ncbi:hypothetical protein ACH79_38975 [Bradyrhizobium sp. CCBAU 051011]|uniref:hypothetical protein n=1 Tax=Bradyrhizobium sp. CCBAU 051011 TaxID=858422 RepID=UPI001373DF66|nr:hypothetical protein [Bradyrhizobium sp. CCBAU 051011]QHO77714.1 hypothetical protein ACH79_38975 [Bradyrhizobium sp. CCBAU 051011]
MLFYHPQCVESARVPATARLRFQEYQPVQLGKYIPWHIAYQPSNVAFIQNVIAPSSQLADQEAERKE